MKNIKSLPVEKLMEIAKTPIKEDEFKRLPPAKRFIISSDIMDLGERNYPIPAYLIYDRYERWCDLYKVRCLDKKAFFKELALYFNKKTTSAGVHYMMSPDGFDLSPAHAEYIKNQKPKKRISNGKKTKTKKEHQD